MTEIAKTILKIFDVFKNAHKSNSEIAMVCKAFQLQINARLPSSTINAMQRLKINPINRMKTALKRYMFLIVVNGTFAVCWLFLKAKVALTPEIKRKPVAPIGCRNAYNQILNH